MSLVMVALLASLVLKSKSAGAVYGAGAVAGDGTLYGDGGGRAVFFSAR